MKTLLLILLLAGSVQGQIIVNVDTTKLSINDITDGGLHWSIGGDIGRPNDSLVVMRSGYFGDDKRIGDDEYWYFEWSGMACAVLHASGTSCNDGTLHRRLDRWYLDTVQVCDTVMTETAHADHSGKYSYETHYSVIVTCRDTTIYAKRVKKTETKWVIPE